MRGGGTSEIWGLTWDLLSGSGFNVFIVCVCEGECAHVYVCRRICTQVSVLCIYAFS